MMDLTSYTDAELTQLATDVQAEQARRYVLATADQDHADLVARYRAAAGGVAPVPWADLGTTVPPGRKFTWNGNTYENATDAWLPTTADPKTYPQGYKQLTGLPVAVAAWAAGVAYKVGDLASYQGVTYKAIQAHTSQVGWEPPNVPALWAVA